MSNYKKLVVKPVTYYHYLIKIEIKKQRKFDKKLSLNSKLLFPTTFLPLARAIKQEGVIANDLVRSNYFFLEPYEGLG